ncbi:MAG: glycerophosphodiester phosphodiesterase family protein [Pseudomonadota bacterium]
MNQTIKIWGHRGCRGDDNPPENSLDAFQAAIDQGADGVELDVFLTKDTQLVVFHDDTLERMTNGTGDITTFTLAELKRLQLKDTKGILTQSLIPTLEEVLNLVGDFRQQNPEEIRAKDFVVNIEIKGARLNQQVAEAIQNRLNNGWSPTNFQVSAGDIDNLREIKKLRAETPLGALFWSDKEPWCVTEQQLAQKLTTIDDLHPQTVNLSLPSLTQVTINMIRTAGAKPVAWTCQEKNPDRLNPQEREALTRQLLNSGITTIITDYPQQMRALLNI